MPNVKKGWLAQFIAFSFIGLINTAVDYIVFQALVWTGLFYMAAQIISYGAGTLNSFLMNRAFTFKQTATRAGSSRAQLIRFVVLNVGVLLCSLLLLYVFVDIGGLPYWLSKLLVTGATVALNFVGSKRWVFREQEIRMPGRRG